MMNMNEFTNTIVSAVSARYAAPSYTVSVHEVLKPNNQRLHGLVIQKSGSNISPSIYLEDFYNHHLRTGCTIEDEVNLICDLYEENEHPTINCDFMDFDQARDIVTYRLINTARNKEYLESRPSRTFLDLSIVYELLLGFDDESNAATISITNEMMKLWGTSEEELYTLASDNTPRLQGSSVRTMMETLTGLLGDSDEVPFDEDCTEPMYVATNRAAINGANVVLTRDVLTKFSLRIRGNFFILFSSCHEVLFIPAELAPSRAELLEMVRSVNATEVSEKDFLSDNIYYFNNGNLEVITTA